MLAHAKAKIAEELGRKNLSDEEYVRWFAKTLGEQFAIMAFFDFDHGIGGEGDLQLTPWNVSLGCEIRDFETSRFSPTKPVHDRYAKENQVSIAEITAAQKNWRDNPNHWLSILLALAPEVDFAKLVLEGAQAKLDEFKEKMIHPHEEIARFNREKWVPYRKGRKQQKS